MNGRVAGLQIGAKTSVDLGNRVADTGIDKRSVRSAEVGTLGLAGDVVVDTAHHGGPDQAVYVYFSEHLEWWRSELARDIPAGSFGENVLIEGLADGPIRVGDRFETDDVSLEVTAPRIPCSVLSAHLGEPDLVKRFRAAGMPGFYTRVIRPGRVAIGDAVRHVPSDGIPVVELYAEWYAKAHDASVVERALASPLSARMREKLESWV